MRHDSLTRSFRPRTSVAATTALVLLLAACSSSGSPSEAPVSQGPAEGGGSVTLSSLAFSVAEISVPVGKLTFVNSDAVMHVLAEGENGVEVSNPRVQKVAISGASEGDLEFTVAGDYHITCTVHPTMNMEVKVQ